MSNTGLIFFAQYFERSHSLLPLCNRYKSSKGDPLLFNLLQRVFFITKLCEEAPLTEYMATFRKRQIKPNLSMIQSCTMNPKYYHFHLVLCGAL